MAREENLAELDRLIECAQPEVEVASPAPAATNGTLPLAGETVVVTGTLPSPSRTEAEELCRRHEANISASVSKKTTLLLAGAKAGSRLAKAKSLGIPVFDEQSLRGRIEGSGSRGDP